MLTGSELPVRSLTSRSYTGLSVSLSDVEVVYDEVELESEVDDVNAFVVM